MQGKNKKHKKRTSNLVVLCAFTAILLTVSTYAWFIGMQTVNVAAFDVNIATTQSLQLSLNGKDWSDTVSISKDTLATVSYANHKNSWGGDGLIPMSTVGEMDTISSRMKLFEKSSLTATPGGYRLMASLVNNSVDEKAGYVVFDLFIKNFTGTQYLTTLNEKDEESIYLTTNSEVKVAAGGVADTGIENSVRVAFTQIGRVKGTVTNQTTITGLTCTSVVNAENEDLTTTGICRNATIWEPNDTEHVDDAIKWYEKSCLPRKSPTVESPNLGKDVTLVASYGGVDGEGHALTCGTVADGTAYSTYAVSQAITSANNVDVYDGADYNTYTKSNEAISEDDDTSYLVDYDYFTDTEKDYKGTARPTFMTLAPNSITKVRIYIYIEGQDIDNYDFAAVGKQISVNFGFTKERYNEDDVLYNGPALDGSNCTGGTIPASEGACTTAGGYWRTVGETSSCVGYGIWRMGW